MAHLRWFALLVIVWGCSTEPPVGDAKGELSALGTPWQFGGVLVGEQEQQTFSLHNAGKVPVTAWIETAPEDFDFAFSAEKPLVVPPSGTVDVVGTFTPSTVGRIEGTVVWRATGAVEDRLLVKVIGEGQSREIELPSTLDFGVVPVGQTRTMEIAVRSLSEKPANVVATLSELGAFSPEEWSITLEPGAEEMLAIHFHPETVGGHSARYTVETCKGCEKTLTLRGQGGAERLHGRPQMVPFGVISPGKSSERELRLENRGYLDVPVRKAIFIEGTDPGFSLKDPESVVTIIPQDGFHTLWLRFDPAADEERGEKRGSLRFLGEDDEWLVDVPVVGFVGGPDLVVEPLSLDFGILPVGVEAKRRVRIINEGNVAPVKLLEVSLAGADSARFSREVRPGTNVAIGAEPGVIDVSYRSSDAGLHTATLIVRTDDDDTSEIPIALIGETRSLGSCDLELGPDAIRFGLVGIDEPAERKLEIRNRAPGACAVWNFELQQGGSRYRVDGMPEGSRLLGPGETLELTFSMATATPGPRETARMVFSHSAEGRSAQVELSGQVAPFELQVIPPVVDFGTLRQGDAEAAMVSVVNRGTPVEISRFGLAGGDEPFSAEAMVIPGGLQGVVTAPGRMETGARAAFLVGVEGAAAGEAHDRFEVYLNGYATPVIVPISALISDSVCDQDCGSARAVCQSDERVRVNAPTPVLGASAPAGDGGAACQWTLLDVPPRSMTQVSSTNSCAAVLHTDRPGDYLMQLSVSSGSGVSTCTTRIRSTPPKGLWLETLWQNPSDVDLILLHPNAGNPENAFTWNSSGWSCTGLFCGHDWDEPGPRGNPLLERWSNSTGIGPEQMGIELPPPGRVYAVGVRWWQSRGFPSNLVTTDVYCDGELLESSSVTLTSNRETVFLGTFEYSGRANCQWRTNGMRW